MFELTIQALDTTFGLYAQIGMGDISVDRGHFRTVLVGLFAPQVRVNVDRFDLWLPVQTRGAGERSRNLYKIYRRNDRIRAGNGFQKQTFGVEWQEGKCRGLSKIRNEPASGKHGKSRFEKPKIPAGLTGRMCFANLPNCGPVVL